MIDLNELTVGQLKDIQKMCGVSKETSSHWIVGKNYFIRTVTMILTGKLVSVETNELVIEEAAWIPDTGRYMQAIAEGNFNEVEPYPDGTKVIIGRNAIIDACEFLRPLPRKQI